MFELSTQHFIESLINFSTTYLIPFMAIVFVCSVLLRFLVYYTVKREYYFVREFGKRVREYYAALSKEQIHSSFYIVTKHLLFRAFNDVFEMRRKYKRRRPDHIMSISDRLFLVEDGVYRLVRDTLKQIRYLNKKTNDPRLLDLSKGVFDVNPVFNKVFGILPLSLVHDFLNLLPGLFIIGGIFGTFLGIMKALPELGGMNLTNAEETREIMDLFLVKMSFSMSTSIIGILLSVIMTGVNTVFSPDTLFYKLVNHYTDSMNLIWNETITNEVPQEDEKLFYEEYKGYRQDKAKMAPKTVKKEVIKKPTIPIKEVVKDKNETDELDLELEKQIVNKK